MHMGRRRRGNSLICQQLNILEFKASRRCLPFNTNTKCLSTHTAVGLIYSLGSWPYSTWISSLLNEKMQGQSLAFLLQVWGMGIPTLSCLQAPGVSLLLSEMQTMGQPHFYPTFKKVKGSFATHPTPIVFLPVKGNSTKRKQGWFQMEHPTPGQMDELSSLLVFNQRFKDEPPTHPNYSYCCIKVENIVRGPGQQMSGRGQSLSRGPKKYICIS